MPDEVLGFLIVFAIMTVLGTAGIAAVGAMAWVIWTFPWILVIPMLAAFFVAGLAVASNSI